MQDFKHDLCFGCMEPKTGETVCPNCGYIQDSPYLPSYIMPGTILNDRYIVGKLKNYNGESANYIGYDTVTENKVMIKEYMPDALCTREKGSNIISVNPNYVAQYKTYMSEFVELNKTLSKMRTLNHIIPAADMFGDNNTGYVIFNYFDGITLSQFLKHNAGEISWEEVKAMFPPIFTTLSLVHNAGLTHRGISPDNILINEEGEIKLTGFCIGDARTANTELASELYNGFAAPEQYNSSNWQGTWTDVYGVSALLYRMLTGVVPADAISRMTNDTLIEPAKLNPSIPRNVSKVIMNGLAMSEELRIQTITEFVTQLFEQPEYNSVRLSSSSTQTIAIPKQYRGRDTDDVVVIKRPSRHFVFLLTAGISLIIGLVFIILLIVLVDDTSTDADRNVEITQFSSDVSEITITAAPESKVSEQKAATASDPSQLLIANEGSASMIYVMTDIVGKPFDSIKNSSTYSSLVFVPKYEYNDSVAKGLIFEQSIKKDDSYNEGAEITVKVSLGPKQVNIPEYISINKKDYFTILDNLGIKYEEKQYETTDVLEGYVAKLSKEPGEKIDVEAGETLVVYVAVYPAGYVETHPPVTDPKTGDTISTAEPDIVITAYD